MCCSLREEPKVEAERFVRLTSVRTFDEAYDWCQVLLDAGVRCRVICERLAAPQTTRTMLPVLHVHPDDLRHGRMILRDLTRQKVLPYAGSL